MSRLAPAHRNIPPSSVTPDFGVSLGPANPGNLRPLPHGSGDSTGYNCTGSRFRASSLRTAWPRARSVGTCPRAASRESRRASPGAGVRASRWGSGAPNCPRVDPLTRTSVPLPGYGAAISPPYRSNMGHNWRSSTKGQCPRSRLAKRTTLPPPNMFHPPNRWPGVAPGLSATAVIPHYPPPASVLLPSIAPPRRWSARTARPGYPPRSPTAPRRTPAAH